MRKTIEEIVEAIEELYASGKYDAEFRKKLITNSIQARDEALLAELESEVETLIDQNDDGMWAGRETADAVLALLDNKNV